MNSISVLKIEEKNYRIYASLFSSILSKNKFFDITSSTTVYVCNNGQIDIGVILLKEIDNSLEINIYQSPNVCRMSIISLIEIACLLGKDEIKENIKVRFKLINSHAYLFKFKIIFKEYTEDTDIIEVDSNVIKNISKEEITFREISFSEF